MVLLLGCVQIVVCEPSSRYIVSNVYPVREENVVVADNQQLVKSQWCDVNQLAYTVVYV